MGGWAHLHHSDLTPEVFSSESHGIEEIPLRTFPQKPIFVRFLNKILSDHRNLFPRQKGGFGPLTTLRSNGDIPCSVYSSKANQNSTELIVMNFLFSIKNSHTYQQIVHNMFVSLNLGEVNTPLGFRQPFFCRSRRTFFKPKVNRPLATCHGKIDWVN